MGLGIIWRILNIFSSYLSGVAMIVLRVLEQDEDCIKQPPSISLQGARIAYGRSCLNSPCNYIFANPRPTTRWGNIHGRGCAWLLLTEKVSWEKTKDHGSFCNAIPTKENGSCKTSGGARLGNRAHGGLPFWVGARVSQLSVTTRSRVLPWLLWNNFGYESMALFFSP
jgi:hypothetical protein